MELADALREVGNNVRVRLDGKGKGFGRGRLISVSAAGQTAIVKPFGHKHKEKVFLTDVHAWKSGNELFRPPVCGTYINERVKVNMGNGSKTPVIASAENEADRPHFIVRMGDLNVFVSPHYGFKPELNRAKSYRNDLSARRAIGHLAKKEKGEIRSVTLEELQNLYDAKYNPKPVAPTPPPAPVQADPAEKPALTDEKLKAYGEAASVLHKLAEAEELYAAASRDREKLR